MKENQIKFTIDEIRNISETLWKKHVKLKSIERALNFLNTTQGSKIQEYKDLKIMPFLSSIEEDVKSVQFIGKIQSQMVENVRMNFKETYKRKIVCQSRKLIGYIQKHVLECQSLIGSNQLVSYLVNYD